MFTARYGLSMHTWVSLSLQRVKQLISVLLPDCNTCHWNKKAYIPMARSYRLLGNNCDVSSRSKSLYVWK